MNIFFINPNLCYLQSKIAHLHMSDISPSMLESACTPEGVPTTKVILDEEKPFPFDTKTFDVVISNLK